MAMGMEFSMLIDWANVCIINTSYRILFPLMRYDLVCDTIKYSLCTNAPFLLARCSRNINVFKSTALLVL